MDSDLKTRGMFFLFLFSCSFSSYLFESRREPYNGVPAPVLPNIDEMRLNGISTLKAKIDIRNFSGPNWYGMMCGSISLQHGVNSNDCETGRNFETIALMLREQKPANFTIAVVHEWDIIICYFEDGTVNFVERTFEAQQTGDAVVDLILTEQPNFIFIHFDGPDARGHGYGGNSQEYVDVCEEIDFEVGRIFEATRQAGIFNETTFILTADHGHHPTSGSHSSTLKPVPFFIYGAGVTTSVDLDVTGEFSRNNQVAPVVAYLFGINPSPDWNSTAAPFDQYIDLQ